MRGKKDTLSAMGDRGKESAYPPQTEPGKETSVSDLRFKRRERRYPRRTWPQVLVLLVSVVAALVLALYQFTVPAVVPAGAPATEFSAQRAMETSLAPLAHADTPRPDATSCKCLRPRGSILGCRPPPP